MKNLINEAKGKNKEILTTLDKITARIKSFNMENNDHPVPDSDAIYKIMLGEVISSVDMLFSYLKVLSDAHYIITIHIEEPDPDRKFKGVNGFVVAETTAINRVRDIYYKKLEALYETQFHKKKSPTSIINELMVNLATYKRTPIGQVMNIAMMLQQMEHLMTEQYMEFNDEWKENKLLELLPDIGGSRMEIGTDSSGSDLYDEGDSAEQEESVINDYDEDELGEPLDLGGSTIVAYHEVETMDLSGKWGSSVEKYGVQFLVRLHFHKHEYAVVRKLIKQKKIAREEDFRFIRDYLAKIEQKSKEDPALSPYFTEIQETRRLAQLKMNQIILIKRGAHGF